MRVHAFLVSSMRGKSHTVRHALSLPIDASMREDHHTIQKIASFVGRQSTPHNHYKDTSFTAAVSPEKDTLSAWR